MKPESEHTPQSAAAPAPDAADPAAAAPKSGRKSAKDTAHDAAAPPTPDDADPAALTADDVMPESAGRRDDVALGLLFDACECFNINPSRTVRPRELAGWRYYPADVVEQVPASVVLVTAGGVKLKYYEGDILKDPDTEERLRNVFRAFAIDPKTKERLPGPLPTDLSLPAEAVLGQPVSAAHRHPAGYLRRPR